MLTGLSISNYTLIDRLEVEFNTGLSILTGETGSGKSVILGALGLILGNRADRKALRNDNTKCVIEGTFRLKKDTHSLFFKKNNLDFELNSIVRREITPQGKSRIFINDTPVSLQQAKELGELLVDMHSQHETLLLNDKSFLFEIIDRNTNAGTIKQKYQALYKTQQQLSSEIDQLRVQEEQSKNDRDYNLFLMSEFSAIDLADIKNRDLEQEYSILSNAEEIRRLGEESLQIMDNEHHSLLSALKSIKNNISRLSELDINYEALKSRLVSCEIELNDIYEDISQRVGSVELDGKKMIQLEELINTTNSLLKKHHLTHPNELIGKKEELQQKLDAITSLAITINNKEVKEQENQAQLVQLGKKWRTLRNEGIPDLEEKGKKLLDDMNMPNAEFKIVLSPIPKPGPLGLDQIDFLVKTNAGSGFEPLQKIASGGEMSRIMLAIKALQSRKIHIPTMIFDEIDTGVSGKVALAMGNIMKSLSEQTQVICITHLPQIAGKGDHHYKVSKKEVEKKTEISMAKLSNTDRINEIASMLGGDKITDAALSNAKELLH